MDELTTPESAQAQSAGPGAVPVVGPASDPGPEAEPAPTPTHGPGRSPADPARDATTAALSETHVGEPLLRPGPGSGPSRRPTRPRTCVRLPAAGLGPVATTVGSPSPRRDQRRNPPGCASRSAAAGSWSPSAPWSRSRSAAGSAP